MSKVVIQIGSVRDTDQFVVPEEFAEVIRWLCVERQGHQVKKWGDGEAYVDEDVRHVREGLGDDSWFWVKGVLNYTGRVRLFGVESPLGLQALLKLAATIVCMPEHLLRGGVVNALPEAGVPSGEIR